MTQHQAAQLARIQHRATLYELVATHRDGRRVLAGYCRQGRRGLLLMIRQHGPAWVEFTGSPEATFGARATDGATLGDWAIRFSGRTQRDAILEGELTWFEDAA